MTIQQLDSTGVPLCPCGSERLTFGGGDLPYVCSEAYFTLTDEDAIDTAGWPIPRLAGSKLPSRTALNAHTHLVATAVTS